VCETGPAKIRVQRGNLTPGNECTNNFVAGSHVSH
jgi:hypothetical protein